MNDIQRYLVAVSVNYCGWDGCVMLLGVMAIDKEAFCSFTKVCFRDSTRQFFRGVWHGLSDNKEML